MKREESSAESLSSEGNVALGSERDASGCRPKVSMNGASGEGGRPVPAEADAHAISVESSCSGVQLKAGGKLHLRLNITARPIANKYREGKLQRTLKREFKST